MMSQSQYSLTWEAHVRNVCDGLCSLQQNGEFVDMTLAADGHMVKVHQVVLALASPFFKDLIISAQCPHPVIFLNKITHPTLSAILEYIYTGEVLVSLEHLNDLVEAAKELHIKGLKDMKVHPALMETSKEATTAEEQQNTNILADNGLCLFQVAQEENDSLRGHEQDDAMQYNTNMMQFSNQCVYDDEQLCEGTIGQDMQTEHYMPTQDMESNQFMQDTQVLHGTEDDMRNEQQMQDIQEENASLNVPGDNTTTITDTDSSKKVDQTCTALQYTVSNQGSLQMILNRFMYYLKHTNRDNSRQWRCVDYLSHVAKCPAHVITKDDIVVQRVEVHTHPFHDKRILKKLKTGSIFSAIISAEREGKLKKRKSDHPVLESDESKVQ